MYKIKKSVHGNRLIGGNFANMCEKLILSACWKNFEWALFIKELQLFICVPRNDHYLH